MKRGWDMKGKIKKLIRIQTSQEYELGKIQVYKMNNIPGGANEMNLVW
jgi:hypothetical protein